MIYMKADKIKRSNIYCRLVDFVYLIYLSRFNTDNPPVIKSFASKVVREGQSVTLKCKPNMMWPPEDITYFINGKPVTNPQFKSRYRANCQKLRIDRVKFPDDNGIVSCKVQNKYGYDMKNVTLFVKGKCLKLLFYFSDPSY